MLSSLTLAGSPSIFSSKFLKCSFIFLTRYYDQFYDQIINKFLLRRRIYILENEDIEDDERCDGQHDVENCVESEIVNVYVPVIRSAQKNFCIVCS